jgi:hypothetical protein
MAETRMSQQRWDAFHDKLIRTAQRAQALTDGTVTDGGVDAARFALHEQICAYQDANPGVSYEAALTALSELELKLPAAAVDPEHAALNAQVMAFAAEHQVPYSDALWRVLETG